jgi:hypothetical protein
MRILNVSLYAPLQVNDECCDVMEGTEKEKCEQEV